MPVLWGSEGDPMQERREALRAALAASECPTTGSFVYAAQFGGGEASESRTVSGGICLACEGPRSSTGCT